MLFRFRLLDRPLVDRSRRRDWYGQRCGGKRLWLRRDDRRRCEGRLGLGRVIEGGTARHYGKTKKFMMEDPEGFKQLLAVLADAVADLLIAQIEAGASLVQLFDTWAGDLMPDQYKEFAAPFSRQIIEKVRRPGVPVVHFMNGIAGKVDTVASQEADVISIDWRTDLKDIRAQLGPDVVLQGNLDPCTLYAPHEIITQRAQTVLDANGGGPHVFNLGHGILPDIPVANAKHLVKTVQEISVK